MRLLHIHLIQALVHAAVVTMPRELRKGLSSNDELMRSLAEDGLMNRIMEPLRECAAAGEGEGQRPAKDR